MTPKEVRELISLSRTTLWRLCRAGLFPQPVKISAGRVAFVQEQVEDWMNARLNGGGPSRPTAAADEEGPGSCATDVVLTLARGVP